MVARKRRTYPPDPSDGLMFGYFKWSSASHPRNAITRKYEPIQPYLFLELARFIGATWVLDVGANIGAYSVFSTRLASIARIHAWEPDDDARRALVENIQLNGLGNRIMAHGDVVSSQQGRVDFLIAGPASGINAVQATTIHAAGKYCKSVSLPSISLDAFMDAQAVSHTGPIALKIDVEGHELSVLQGARNLLRAHTCFIQLESYKENNDISEFLLSHSYKPTIKIANDHYYTNHPDLMRPADALRILEMALAAMIADNLTGK